MKITAVKIMIACLLILSILVPGQVYAASAQQHFDVVFVIDDSGSMRKTDPKRLSVEALKRFVDILPRQGDQLGVVTYSSEVVETMSLREIRSESDKSEIKRFAETEITRGGEWTDTAVGLKQAVAYLDEFKQPDHKQLIILVTDGANSFGDSGRTEQQSDADLQEVIGKRYPIYAIGLNPEEKRFRDYISNIATQTEGQAFYPQSVNDLQDIFFTIQETMFETEFVREQVEINPDGYVDVRIEIPEGVFEANIQITHDAAIQYRFVGPDNGTLDAGSAKLVETREARYTNIKLIEPGFGPWTMQLKGAKRETVSYSIILNYDIAVEIQVSEPADGKEPATITVRLSNKNQPLADPKSYENLQATLSIRSLADNTAETIELARDNVSFTAEHRFPAAGDYELTATVAGDQFVKASEPVLFAIPDGAAQTPVDENDPEKRKFPLRQLLQWGAWAVGALIAAALIWMILNRRAKRAVPHGQLKVVVSENFVARPPDWRRLGHFPNDCSLYEVLGREDLLGELRNVKIRGTYDGIKIVNKGNCDIRYQGLSDQPGGVEIKHGQRFKIKLSDNTTEVDITYSVS